MEGSGEEEEEEEGECFEEGTDYKGHGLKDNKVAEVATSGACQEACANRCANFSSFLSYSTSSSSYSTSSSSSTTCSSSSSTRSARAACSHWTWNSATLTCWLKRSSEGRVAREGKVSGPRECGGRQRRQGRQVEKPRRVRRQAADCFEVGFGYAGQGLEDNKVEEVEGPERCQELCQGRPACSHWTWNSGDHARSRGIFFVFLFSFLSLNVPGSRRPVG